MKKFSIKWYKEKIEKGNNGGDNEETEITQYIKVTKNIKRRNDLK
mgnify:CR=1 FL=1